MTKTSLDRGIEQAIQRFATKRRTRSMSLAARRIKRDMQESVRSAIDAATPAELTTDVHPTVAAMVADDARQETRHGDAIASLAQIPPVLIGRVTYRVIAEGDDGGQRKIALLCRTQPSTLARHDGCDCMLCGFVESQCDDHAIDCFRRWSEVEVWYHDKTKTYHLRHIKTGAFKQLSKSIAEAARLWSFGNNGCGPSHTTTADGRLY